jgi:transcriptional regulator with XRE-family HTH domain
MNANELLLMRRAAHITQGELAGRIGYSRQAVVKWERGVHAIPAKMIAPLMEACTVHIPKLETKMTAFDRETVATYAKMRSEHFSHAYIVKLWHDSNFVPSQAAQAAIIEAYPELKGLNSNG